MRTHVIRLEPHDDAVSIRDKIVWSQASRILLTFPKRRVPRLNAVDLNLIHRQAAHLGAQLALVARDPELVDHARMLGIPVFDTVAAAQRRAWTLKRRRRPLSLPDERVSELPSRREAVQSLRNANLPKGVRAAAFSLGLVGFFTLMLFFVPSATIQVVPHRVEQTLTLQLWASPGLPAAIASGGVPAQREKIEVEGSLEGTGSLTTRISDRTAQGKLILTNMSESPVEVPAGTAFQTAGDPPVRFVSRQGVTVPAGVGQTVEVPIEASVAGAIGNVPGNTIQVLEGNLGLLISVINPAPTSGGSDREARAGSEQDYEKLYDELYTSLAEKALRELEDRAGEPVVVVRNSLKLERVIQYQRTPGAGEPADRLRLDLRLEFSALMVSADDIRKTAQLALDASLPDGYRPVGADIHIEHATEPVLDPNGIARWECRVSRPVAAVVPAEDILSKAAGLTPRQAAAEIASRYHLFTEPEIAIQPGWWGRLPFVAFRIHLVEK